MTQPATIENLIFAQKRRAPRSSPDAKTLVLVAPRVREVLPDAETTVRVRPELARGSGQIETATAEPVAPRRAAAPDGTPKPAPKKAPAADGTPPPEVFALIRRIAIQRELSEASGVLHAELGNMLRARVVLAQVAAGGAISSPIPGDLRDAATTIKLSLIAETAKRKQRYVAERVVMVPLATSASTVLVAWRAPNQEALDANSIRLASHVAARLHVLDHFLAAAADKREQAAADHKGVFRPEALAAARQTRKHGELVQLSPRTIRIAIPAIVIVAALLVTAAAIVKVPSYSRGTVVIKANGRNVISNSSGRIASVYVTPGQHVSAGDPLITLDTTQERQNFEQIDSIYRAQLSTFLFDTTDDVARQSLAGILAQRKGALDALTAKTITAPCDGSVSDVLVTDIVQGGEHVATIIPADSAPSVLAFMPGSDGSRLAPGMPLQVELTGYPGSRLTLVITEVGTEIMGATKARKYLGEKLADSVALPPSVVLVKASLPSHSFESRGKTYSFFDGMDGLAEIEIDRKSFLSTVIPTGD